jgi:hypothetical protein
LIDNRVALKAAITALLTLTIASITLMGQVAASYPGGGRELITESKFRNYIALELGPQLYEDEKILRVMKTQLYGFIEKKIFETSYIDSSSADALSIQFLFFRIV